MTTTEIAPDELVALVKKLSSARGPSQELDVAIWRLVKGAKAGAGSAPPLTQSLDAALDLLEEIRPGWVWKLQHSQKGGEFFKFTLDAPDGAPVRGYNEKIPAISVVDALLRSLIEHRAS